MWDNQIHIEHDYNAFKKLCGNRDVVEQRKNTIKDSIMQHGYIRNPIVVNERMEIIDGQGRFEALKELKMPIEYVVAYGAGTEECIALNLKQKNWSNIDFIKSYANMGNENYKILLDITNKYEYLRGSFSWVIATNGFGDGGYFDRVIKAGNAKIYDEKNLYTRLSFGNDLMSHFTSSEYGRGRLWASIVNFLFYEKKINKQKLITNLRKYKGLLVPALNKEQCITNLEKIYNRNCTIKTYFFPLYDEWTKK